MIYRKIGDNINSNMDFFKLKSKGEKIKFRVIDEEYSEDHKHFIKNIFEEKTDVVSCNRMNGDFCEFCDTFWDAVEKLKNPDLSEDQKKELENIKRENNVSVSILYKVFNLDTGNPGIFQTTRSVRAKLKSEIDNFDGGWNEFKSYDFVVTRTESPGADYYSVSRVDSSKCYKMTEEDIEIISDFLTNYDK